jgi:pimeloyl-ACP methyl ester carboxylesterase
MPKVQARGLRTHYQQLGAGPDVVLVHGLGANLAFWYLGVAPLLATHHRVTAFDLRGHGLSGRTVSGYTTRDLADDCLAVMDELGIEHAVVVGHSFGGAVALHVAATTPDRVDRVVAADAYLPCFEPRMSARWDLRARRARRALRRRGLDVPAGLPRVAYGLLDELGRYRPTATERTGDTLAWTSLERSMDRWQALRAQSRIVPEVFDTSLSVDRLRTVHPPVLAVNGARSTLSSASLRGLRSALPDLDVVMVPDAGHLHPLLQPEGFTRHVEAFVTRMTTTREVPL